MNITRISEVFSPPAPKGEPRKQRFRAALGGES